MSVHLLGSIMVTINDVNSLGVVISVPAGHPFIDKSDRWYGLGWLTGIYRNWPATDSFTVCSSVWPVYYRNMLKAGDRVSLSGPVGKLP